MTNFIHCFLFLDFRYCTTGRTLRTNLGGGKEARLRINCAGSLFPLN